MKSARGGWRNISGWAANARVAKWEARRNDILLLSMRFGPVGRRNETLDNVEEVAQKWEVVLKKSWENSSIKASHAGELD